MTRNPRHHLPPDDMPGDGLAPRALTKQEFARRLTRLMMERNMRQSDLARAAFGTTLDTKGRTVAKGRDSISSYSRGRTMPDPKSLSLLAKALDVSTADLLPNTVASAIDADVPALELKQATGHPGRAWLRLNRLMSFEAASKIVSIVEDDERRLRNSAGGG